MEDGKSRWTRNSAAPHAPRQDGRFGMSHGTRMGPKAVLTQIFAWSQRVVSTYLRPEQQFPFAHNLKFDPTFERQRIDRQPVLPKAEPQFQLVGRCHRGCGVLVLRLR